jgi:thiol-disulfide isomerase/thioredoxin
MVLALTVLNVASVHPTSSFPDQTLAEDLNGKPLDPFGVSQGRVVVLVFVRTDCPISNRYAPLLEKLSEEFRGKANFWLVYPDREQTALQIKAHLRDFHYSIPALRDIRHALVRRSQATITPEAALFDPSGRLLYHGRIDNWYEDFGRSRAAATTHELSDAISAALGGRTISVSHANAVGCYISDLK